MTTKINPPSFNSAKSYERFKQELLAWREITELSKNKQGIAVALSLPDDDENKIKDKVFDQIALDELKNENGLNILIAFLDKHLGKDDLADSIEKFEDFDDFKRKDGQTIQEFIAMFDSKYRKIEKKDMSLPSEILAFKLLKKANITKEEKLLVLTGMNFDNKAYLYEEAKSSLKKFKGDDIHARENENVNIKLEPAYLAENEDVLLAAGYVKNNAFYDEGKERVNVDMNLQEISIPRILAGRLTHWEKMVEHLLVKHVVPSVTCYQSVQTVGRICENWTLGMKTWFWRPSTINFFKCSSLNNYRCVE